MLYVLPYAYGARHSSHTRMGHPICVRLNYKFLIVFTGEVESYPPLDGRGKNKYNYSMPVRMPLRMLQQYAFLTAEVAQTPLLSGAGSSLVMPWLSCRWKT